MFTLTPAVAGTDTVTATDSANSLTGSVNLNVSARQVATQFFLVAASTVYAGTPTAVTAIALDASNQWVRGYAGTV